jgi:putative glycosyltransferase (TIGR04372 family)
MFISLSIAFGLASAAVYCVKLNLQRKKTRDALNHILANNTCEVFKPMFIDRIGHLAGEVDLLLKERILRGKCEKPLALIACKNSAANTHLLSYLREKFRIVVSPDDWKAIQSSFPDVRNSLSQRPDYYVAINETAKCYAIYAKWGKKEPLFILNANDRNFVRTTLQSWGVQEGDWFVCLHNRERGYSPKDDDLHDYRNASIESYLSAIDEITSRGGWVIRMGDPSTTPLPALPHVIDYAHSPFRSARLDICLSASARFFLGTSSGLFILGTLFGVPTALVNLTPFSAEAHCPDDLKIPKKLSTVDGRLLTFHEIMNSPVANFRFSDQYKKAGIKVLSNSAEEILDLATEMLDRLNGEQTYTEEDEQLQLQFRSLMRPGHYGYGSLARTGQMFLRKNKALFDGVACKEKHP